VRIKQNEERFREINERLERDLRQVPDDGSAIDFVCECGHIDCAQGVRLTLGEFAEVRGHDGTFVVLAGHEIPDTEDVVDGTDRYLVVRKRPV
jgi:hypothetical protein